jgi:hypothetical protein
MAVPQLNQGVLNRIKASITVASNNALSVGPTNLGREGIRLTLEGNATDYFPTMTGAVPSPAPYQVATLTLNLLKTQTVANVYQNAFLTSTLLGQVTVYPDVSVASNVPPPTAGGAQAGLAASQNPILAYVLLNSVLESVNPMTFSGEEPLYVVTIKGYILVNSNFFI